MIDEDGFVEYYAQKILPTGNIQDTSSKHFAQQKNDKETFFKHLKSNGYGKDLVKFCDIVE